MPATLQAPPNGTGTIIDGITQGVNFRQTVNQGDPTIVGNPTYRATYKAVNVGTLATTNIASIAGSASKTVKVTKVVISGTKATAAESYSLQLVKQSAADTGGTPATAATIVPLDSGNAAASAAAPKAYTAAPTAGAVVGAIAAKRVLFPITGAEAIPFVYEAGLPGKQGIVLRGVAEVLAVTLGGATPGHASVVDMEFEWTEE